MAIKSLKPDMVVANGDHPQRLKKGGKINGLKGYLDGGAIDQDPLTNPNGNQNTPVAPATPAITNPTYNSEAYRAALEKFKKESASKKIPMKDGFIQLPKGDLRTQVPLLTNSLKQRQDYLYNYMKTNNKSSLTAKEADAQLKAGNLGGYDTYISDANDYGDYRNLTVVPKQDLNQVVDIGVTSQSAGQGGGYTMDPSVPFDSTHVQKMFPKNTYTPKKKNGGGIKGYIEGGAIDDQSALDRPQARKYGKNTAGNLAHDTALGIADLSLNQFGLENAIQDKDYNTKTGGKFNAASRGIGTIGRSVTGGVLNYFIPGAGTAINTGLGIGSNVTGQDEGISAKDRATQDKVSGGFDTASNVVSMVGGEGGIKSMLGNKKSKISAPADSSQYVDENGIDTRTGEIAQTQQVQQNGTPSVQQVTSGDQLTGQALTDWKSALTGEAKAQILSNYNSGMYAMKKGGQISAAKAKEILHDGTVHGHPLTDKQRKFMGAMSNKKADGGKIVGPGTGKSDSITANMEDQGFIVPAVNAKKAEELREKYLGDSKKKIASLNKGGVPVKVSNGEHYFTKDEKELLLAKGVDLDALAPNADVSAEGKQDGGTLYGVYKDGKYYPTKEEIIRAYNSATALNKAIQKDPNKFSVKEKQDAAKKLSETYKQYSAIPKEQTATEKMQAQVEAKRKELGTTKTPEKTDKKPAVTPSTKGGISNVGKIKDVPAEKANMETLPMLSSVVSNPVQPEITAQVQEVPINTATSTGNKPGEGILSGIDIGKGLAVGQVGLGLSSLLKDGKRPVDQIDPEFAATVAEAQKDAQTGISPLEREIAYRNIDRNRAADEQTIINLSNGSAGTALANIRAASIAANDAKNNLSAMSEQLRLQKKRYADSKVSEKAAMSKQLFNEKLGAFEQNQEAGAMLLGSGIRNLIGSSMLNTEQQAAKERENKYNPTFTIS